MKKGGYGDFRAYTEVEVLFGIISTLIAGAFFGYTLGKINMIISETINSVQKYRDQKMNLISYMD